jgi:phosphoribosylformylglycinamidine cyclo-ligase
LRDWLLAPTRIYVKSVLAPGDGRAAGDRSHHRRRSETPRVVLPGTAIELEPSAWTRSALFRWLQDEGAISDAEMFRTFNCGIGLCVIVASSEAERALRALSALGEDASRIGAVVPGEGEVRIRS